MHSLSSLIPSCSHTHTHTHTLSLSLSLSLSLISGLHCVYLRALYAPGLTFARAHAFVFGRQAAEHGKEMLALHSKMREVADKVQQVEDDMECSFCMERPASTALVPCGHCFCCKEGCGSKTLSVCPCCQSKFALSLLIETCLCVKSKIPH